MCLEENRKIMLERAEKSGFGVGTPVKRRRKTGVVCGVNALCQDSVVVMVYVRFEGSKHTNLVNVDELKIQGVSHG